METYEVLEKALALIEDEWNWVPHSGGVGGPYCAVGALLAVEGTCGILKVPGYQSLADAAFPLSIPRFNDTHSHAEVCDLFRAAIRREKARLGVIVDLPAIPAIPTKRRKERIAKRAEKLVENARGLE